MADAPAREVERLYGLDLDEFITARDATSAAREEGKRDAAAAVKALRKPSNAAWIVNRLSALHPGVVSRLLEAGHALREVQLQGGGEKLRDAIAAERGALERAMRNAEEIATHAGLASPVDAQPGAGDIAPGGPRPRGLRRRGARDAGPRRSGQRTARSGRLRPAGPAPGGASDAAGPASAGRLPPRAVRPAHEDRGAAGGRPGRAARGGRREGGCRRQGAGRGRAGAEARREAVPASPAAGSPLPPRCSRPRALLRRRSRGPPGEVLPPEPDQVDAEGGEQQQPPADLELRRQQVGHLESTVPRLTSCSFQPSLRATTPP